MIESLSDEEAKGLESAITDGFSDLEESPSKALFNLQKAVDKYRSGKPAAPSAGVQPTAKTGVSTGAPTETQPVTVETAPAVKERDLDGVTVKVPAYDEQGNMGEVSVAAKEALAENDKQLDFARRLLECLNS